MNENQDANSAEAEAAPAPSSSSDNVSTISNAVSVQSLATSTTSKNADSTRPSSLTKPSGLKPPTKIGRLCSNAAPKPAVPISPRSDGSSDSVRKLSDDSRKHLSDHSVVLTEDTDSFIIGERVWVGGTKPGQIAYIGETQFAPGEWAGIVLDDPIGKNDGAVAGVRYFQCSEKRGVFSRLTRLTRAPLSSHDGSPVSEAGSVFDRPPSSRLRRPLSPNGSVRSVTSKMNASVSTTNGELRLGDRVIVSSSRGSKAGILRYVGITDFASGIWAGVELDDPLGKNDGSVEGKRYFDCGARFGLFAPIAKVSRSPSSRRPGACAVHSSGRGTPAPLRRSSSRDSLVSLSTSVASSRAPARLAQELLREKQHHLERLMKERELERAEVAKVSLQANRAETALAILQKEANQASNENEKLKVELGKINKLLEDEKQKVEDLLFRTEEENINREDYNKYKEAMEQEKAVREHKIRELEAEISLQAARAEAASAALLALEDQRSAETAATADQHKEELAAAHTLSSELQKLLDEAYALLKEKENEKDSLGKSMSEELLKVKAEAEKSLNEAKTKIAIAQTEFETQLSVVTTKLQLAESKLEAEKQNVERLNKENSHTVLDLNTKLSQLQATVDDKTHELNKVISVNKEHEVNLNKEITKLKMELSAKILDLEQAEDAKAKQEVVFKSMQEEITRVKEDYSNKVNEYEVLLTDVMQQNEVKKTEVLQLQQSLSVKTKEYEKLLTESNTFNSSSEKLINEYKDTILERDKEIIKLKDEFEQTTANFNINHSKIAEEHKKEIEERNTKIDQLTKEIETHKSALDQTKLEFDTMNIQYTTNVSELQTLKEENENLKKTIFELTQNNTELKEKLASMELEIGEFKRLYESSVEKCDELEKAKEKIEAEYMNLTGQTTDSSEQFLKLSHHLKETESELQKLKDKNRETANNHARIEQELKQKIFKLQEDFSVERGQMVRTIDENAEKIKLSENKAKEFEDRVNELKNQLQNYETNNDKLADENSRLKNEIEALKVKEQELVIEFDSIRKKLEIEIDKYNEEVSLLKAEGVSSEVKLMEKVDQLTEAQNDLNNKLEESRKHEDALQKIVEDMNSRLNNQKTHYENEISILASQLASVNKETDNQKSGKTQLEEMIVEKENKVKDLAHKLEMLEVDFKSNVEILTEKDHQIVQLNEELGKASEYKQNVEEQLYASTLEIGSLKQKYDSLLANSSVEESLFKGQIEQLETLRKESALLRQENSSFDIKCKELADELDRLKQEHNETIERLKENKLINEELDKKLLENEHLLKTHTEQHETDSTKLLKLQDELCHLQQRISEQNNAIKEKETELSILNNNLGDETEATKQLIQQIQKENSEINEKYNKEIESLNNTTNLLQSRILEQENLLREFQQTKEKVIELQALLSKSDSDVKQLTDINEAQKLNYQDLFDHYKKESKQIKHELKAKLEECQKELEESKEKVKSEVDKQNQLQQRLSNAEQTILELNNRLEIITVQQTSDADKDEKLEKMTVELQQTRKSNAEKLLSSEAAISELKLNIESRIKDLKDKEDFIKKLQEDVKNLNVKIEITAREKALLEKELAKTYTEVRDKNDNKPLKTIESETTENQTQDKEITDGQVSFLNSVIVDMQRKNEQLLARVQALESGSTGAEPLIFNGRKSRVVAPRLFCDICEVFDAHDTEECPRQSAEPAPVAGPKRSPPPPRPYCDICEVFGHATDNCDEEETF